MMVARLLVDATDAPESGRTAVDTIGLRRVLLKTRRSLEALTAA
jgi:hypothetical protein